MEHIKYVLQTRKDILSRSRVINYAPIWNSTNYTLKSATKPDNSSQAVSLQWVGQKASLSFNDYWYIKLNGTQNIGGLKTTLNLPVKNTETVFFKVKTNDVKNTALWVKLQGQTTYQKLTRLPSYVEYQVTNLLGSYGSFSTDSNGDGVADGWNLTNRNIVEACVVSNGIQYYKKTAQALATQYWVSIWSQHIPTNNTDRWFIKARAKVQSTQSSSDVVRTLYVLGTNSSNVNVWSTGGVTSLYFPFNADFQTSYTSYTFTNTAVVAFRLMGFYVEHSYLPIGSVNEVWIDYAQVVNLTAMGELPQALKQFFAPSNITKWEDFAVFGNANVMCILKDANGNYIAKKGNDWLNDLIPYVENTATVQFNLLPDNSNVAVFSYTATSNTTIDEIVISWDDVLGGNTGSLTIEGFGVYLDINNHIDVLAPYVLSEFDNTPTRKALRLKNGSIEEKNLVLAKYVEYDLMNTIITFARINPKTGLLIDSDANITGISKNGDNITLNFRIPLNKFGITVGELDPARTELIPCGARCEIVNKTNTSITFKIYDETGELNPNREFVVLIFR